MLNLIRDSRTINSRRYGYNAVTKLIKPDNGNVIIVAAARSLPDGGVPAQVRPGDSGGACVRKDDTNVLIGITTMVHPSRGRGAISYYTSAFRYSDWISEKIRLAHLAADAGMSVPDLDAGLPPSPPPVDR